jgi:hypothetical protein
MLSIYIFNFYQRCWGGVLNNGPNIDPFPTCKEVWVTEGIFFNGVVPWEILIIVLAYGKNSAFSKLWLKK